MSKSKFICSSPFYYDGVFYKAGDSIILEEKKPAPLYFALRECEYKGHSYRGGEFGYFPDEAPPYNLFAPLGDFGKYKPQFFPFDKVVYVKKE